MQGGIEDAQIAYESGFDYIECNFSQVMALPRAEFDEWKKRMQDMPIRCEAMNGMLPGTFRRTGPDADLTPVREFLKEAFARAAEIALPVVVFGSSAARNIPADADGNITFPMDKALDQVAEYLWMAGELARPSGTIIAIEPLRVKECNIIQRVSEGAEMARRVNHPNVRLLADEYHMIEMNESEHSIIDAGFDLMRHCHTADPVARKYPHPDGTWDYKPFFDALKSIGYEGRVSIEGGCDDFVKDAPRAFGSARSAQEVNQLL